MRCFRTILLVASAVLPGVSALATPISYHEHWDSYGIGLADPTYNTVWTPDASVNTGYIQIWNTNTFVAPNSLLIDARNRALDNSLVDGVSNVGILGPGDPDAGGPLRAPEGNEMNPGERVLPAGDLGDPQNMSLGLYHYMANTAMRRHIAVYTEVGFGSAHAPWGANALDPLGAPIPVLAVGKLNSTFTDSIGGNADNVGIYFFNGQQWIRTALGSGTGYNRYWADVYYNLGLGKWQARIREANSGQSGIYDLATGFNPQALGFNAVSFRELNSGKSWSGNSAVDDVYLTGGRVLPEPAALALLGLGVLPLLLRRRRSA